MSFVIDASVAAAAALLDENLPSAALLMERAATMGGGCAPSILPLEFLNILIVAERRGRIDAAYIQLILTNIRRVVIDVDDLNALGAESNVLELATRFRCSAYDAAYLELALRKRIPLATLDGRLADAARAAGVDLL